MENYPITRERTHSTLRLRDLIPERDWAAQGACREAPEAHQRLFDLLGSEAADKKQRVHQCIRAAKAICDVCEVREPCLEDAIANPDFQGVQGGQTKHAVMAIREERGLTVRRSSFFRGRNHE